MRIAELITLTEDESVILKKWERGRSTPARLVLRAQIVLSAAAGERNDQIASKLGCRRLATTLREGPHRWHRERCAAPRPKAESPRLGRSGDLA